MYYSSPMNLTGLLDKLTRLSANSSQQGTAFERMMRTYLQADPLYSDRFEKVFSWMEWPDRPTRECDTGIDLVGIKRDGGVCAIQCKFIPADQSVSKPAIDSLLPASSREPFTSSQLRLSDGSFVDWSSRRPSLVRWSHFDFIGGGGFGMAISKFDLSQL